MSDFTNFARKTVMVTGAAGNLGRAVTTAFAQLGANLVLLDQRVDQLEADGRTNKPTMHVAGVSLLNQAQVNKCVKDAIGKFGRIDVLCNLAGKYVGGEPVLFTNHSMWEYVHEMNVGTLLNTVRAVVPHMAKQGRGKIINVGAMSAVHAAPGAAAYASAKSSVMRITEAMAAELQYSHINVNCVLPSILDTPENRASMPDADFSTWVNTAALADVILFLASDAARAINGAMLPVRGLVRETGK